MDPDKALTRFAGVMVISTGFLSLVEALLQVQLFGDRLPLVQGTFISLFTISFGALLFTEDASTAFKKFRSKCWNVFRE